METYTKRVWTASKWIHLNTKMSICSLPSIYFIVFYEVFAQLWLQLCLYRWLWLKWIVREWQLPNTGVKRGKQGKQVPGKKAGAFFLNAIRAVKRNKSQLLSHRLPTGSHTTFQFFILRLHYWLSLSWEICSTREPYTHTLGFQPQVDPPHWDW